MKKVKLGEICEKASSNIAQKDLEKSNGRYPIYGASGFIKNVDFYKQDKEYIAIVKDGAGVGRTMLFPAYSSIIGTMQYILPNPTIDIKYLYYVLTWMNLAKYCTGATIPHIYFKDYKDEEFLLPSLEEQKAIAERLDKVSELIEKRKAQLEKFDLLIKSRFIEIMESAELSDELTVEQITERVKVGFVGTCEKYYTDETGIPMLRTGNITDCGIDMRDLKYVTADFHKKNKKSQICKGDLLIARHGSNGQANVYDGPEAQCLNAVVVVPNQSVARSMFLAGLINSSAVKRQIDKTLVGSTQHVVNTKSIANLIVRIPNLEVQKQYENFVEQVDKSKFEIQKSLEKLEILKKSLMQKYFG